MGRTFQRLVAQNPFKSSTNQVTVNKRECSIARSITPAGWVAKCTKCGTVGEPSPLPETATLECPKGDNND